MPTPDDVQFPPEEVDDLDPDSSSPDELVAQEEKKADAAQKILDDIANAEVEEEAGREGYSVNDD